LFVPEPPARKRWRLFLCRLRHHPLLELRQHLHDAHE